MVVTCKSVSARVFTAMYTGVLDFAGLNRDALAVCHYNQVDYAPALWTVLV